VVVVLWFCLVVVLWLSCGCFGGLSCLVLWLSSSNLCLICITIVTVCSILFTTGKKRTYPKVIWVRVRVRFRFRFSFRVRLFSFRFRFRVRVRVRVKVRVRVRVRVRVGLV
jgi:hypothetical protein